MIDGYPTYTDQILNNPEGWSVAQSLSAYIRGNYNGPFVQDIRYLEQYYTLENQRETPTVWAAAMPPPIRFLRLHRPRRRGGILHDYE